MENSIWIEGSVLPLRSTVTKVFLICRGPHKREDYLVKTMRKFKNNTCLGYDAAMADVLYPISDEQIADLTYFLAHLR